METDRLILRNWNKKDFKEFMEFASDSEVMTPSGAEPARNKQDGKKKFQTYLRNGTYYAITLKESGRIIGNIKFQEDFRRYQINSISIGYQLNKAYWGKGYAPEALKAMLKFAFELREVDVVGIAHFVENHRSQRVIEKCGFVKEGLVRWSYRRFDGVKLDELSYSMLKDEYLKTLSLFPCRIFIM